MIGATPPSSMCRGDRRLCEFAPSSRESLILPLRGANPAPGKAPGGCGSLRPLPGKPYSSVERRKPFAGESARSFF